MEAGTGAVADLFSESWNYFLAGGRGKRMCWQKLNGSWLKWTDRRWREVNCLFHWRRLQQVWMQSLQTLCDFFFRWKNNERQSVLCWFCRLKNRKKDTRQANSHCKYAHLSTLAANDPFYRASICCVSAPYSDMIICCIHSVRNDAKRRLGREVI